MILNATPTEQRDMMEVLRVGGQYVTLVTPLLANNDRFGVALGTSLSALSLGCDVAKVAPAVDFLILKFLSASS